MKISVLGSGSWGIAIANLLYKNGHDIAIWSHTAEESQMLKEQRCSPRLPDVLIEQGIELTSDISCLSGAQIVVMAVPSFAVWQTAKAARRYLQKGTPIVLLSKGFDADNGYCLLSDTIEGELGADNPVVALTGPSHAEEVARQVPTAVVAASADIEAAEFVQRSFMTDYFRIYTSTDIVSAELGGAMKNIMAIAVGICDGAGYGDNTIATLMTRGITEMSRLGVFLGGRAETFAGLSGIGDLIVTCISRHSRNRRAGVMIGQGMPAEQAIEKVGAVVEGQFAARAVHTLAKNSGLSLPICDAVYEVLFSGAPVKDKVRELITRDMKREDTI